MSTKSVLFRNSAQELGRVRAAQLFDRFFTMETARGSTGLGLSIARQLTERIGGHITAGYDGTLQICICFPP